MTRPHSTKHSPQAGRVRGFLETDATGKTLPFDIDDPADGLLDFLEQYRRRGVFRFTAAHLAALNVTSGAGPGKCGFRLYPSWCEALPSPASVTQHAQARGFPRVLNGGHVLGQPCEVVQRSIGGRRRFKRLGGAPRAPAPLTRGRGPRYYDLSHIAAAYAVCI